LASFHRFVYCHQVKSEASLLKGYILDVNLANGFCFRQEIKKKKKDYFFPQMFFLECHLVITMFALSVMSICLHSLSMTRILLVYGGRLISTDLILYIYLQQEYHRHFWESIKVHPGPTKSCSLVFLKNMSLISVPHSFIIHSFKSMESPLCCWGVI
jgi:hypothetical protein